MINCKYIEKKQKMSCGHVSWQDYCTKNSVFLSDIELWTEQTDLKCPCEHAGSRKYHLYACAGCGFNTTKKYEDYDQEFKCPTCKSNSELEIFPTNHPEELKSELGLA